MSVASTNSAGERGGAREASQRKRADHQARGRGENPQEDCGSARAPRPAPLAPRGSCERACPPLGGAMRRRGRWVEAQRVPLSYGTYPSSRGTHGAVWGWRQRARVHRRCDDPCELRTPQARSARGDDDARGTRGANPQTLPRSSLSRRPRRRGFVSAALFSSVSASHEPLSPAASATSASLASVYAHMMVAPFTAPDASPFPPPQEGGLHLSVRVHRASLRRHRAGHEETTPGTRGPAGGGSRDRHVVPRVSTATKRARVTECRSRVAPRRLPEEAMRTTSRSPPRPRRRAGGRSPRGGRRRPLPAGTHALRSSLVCHHLDLDLLGR